MSKTNIFGYGVSIAGTCLWLYGYFVGGHPSLIDWHTLAPEWFAKFLPNLEAEGGMGLMIAAMLPMYWPTKRKVP
jgi:hypothetical protein